MQLVINPERSATAADLAKEIRNEFVLQASGEVVARSPETVNPKMATGEVELLVDELDIVSRSTPLPFQLEEEGVEETLRLRYRWLDLRTERMQRNLRLRSTVVAAIRRSMEEQGFLDVWTPGLTLGTPEGARDFLVPVRLQPGTFFALAQSPQLFKQALMIGGFDRYYQIATCWRDEDLRADRQFEFRQLDLELAFPTRDDVLEVLERMVVASFDALEREPPARPFPRLSYADAMLKYGSDKPDLRFELEIQDGTEVTRGSEFGVFAGAPVVRFLVVPQELSRGDLAKLEEFAKEWGAKGLAYLVSGADGEVRSPIAKFLSQAELDAFAAPPASTVLFAADEEPAVERVLGALRLHLGRELGLVDEERDAFHWILDFPLFQRGRRDRSLDVRAPSVHRCARGARGADRERSRKRAQPTLRLDLERLGARLGLDQDPPVRRAGEGLPRDGHERGGRSGEVRLVPRGAADGRAAAWGFRARSRPLRRAPRRRARHSAGHRVSEDLERDRSPDRRPYGDLAEVLGELGIRVLEEPS